MKIALPLAILALSCTLLLGCGARDAAETDAAADATAEGPTGPRWERDGLVVYPFAGPEVPEARLSLENVEDGQDLSSADEMQLDFGVEGFALGEAEPEPGADGLATSKEGRHIQVLLNGEPYGEYGEPSFGVGFEPGAYVLTAYLAQPHYESVKDPRAGVLRYFTVDGTAATPIDPSAPHLFFGTMRSAGEGVGTGKVLLDFYLFNTELSPDGNRVRATLNGTEFILTGWTAYVVEGLNVGEAEVKLELLDAEGRPVPGPFNSVTRTVTLAGSEA